MTVAYRLTDRAQVQPTWGRDDGQHIAGAGAHRQRPAHSPRPHQAPRLLDGRGRLLVSEHLEHPDLLLWVLDDD
jgi:hypothetical protein